MNKALVVILITVTLDAIGIGLIMPILPGLLRELEHSSGIATHYGALISLYAAMQFFFAPILGALSDRFGRRPVLLVSLVGAAIDYLVMALTPTLSILYVGRIISGITGANMAVATAYIADITKEDERAKRYGYMSACFGIGFIIGPALGGLIGDLSPRHPFFVAAFLNGMNFLLACFVLPESHKAKGKKVSLSALNPLASLRWISGVRPLLPLLAIFIIIAMVGQFPASLWVIYAEDRFGWDTAMVGASLAAFGLLHALAQAFLTGPLSNRLGEMRSLGLGIIADAAGFLLFGLASRGWMVFAVIPLLCLGGIAMPALQAMTSKQVGEDRQGELQGTITSLMSLVSIFGPLAATTLYASVTDLSAGLVWIVAAALYLLCVPIFLRRPRTAQV